MISSNTWALGTAILTITTCVILSCNNDDEIRRVVRDEMSKSMERKIVAPVQVAGPYRPAVRLGGFLFNSGQIGIDQESGKIVKDSIEVETRKVLENISTILHAEDYDSSDVVSTTV